MCPIASIIITLSFITPTLAGGFVLHEKRNEHLSIGLEKRRLQRDAVLPMRIALMQNQHARLNAEQWLMDVSHPASENYGRHWTPEEVVDAFQPSEETIRDVTSWLHQHGIDDFRHSSNKLWVSFDIPASKAEQMLHTKYFQHVTENGEVEAFCDYYHLPEHLSSHINYVQPTVDRRIFARHSATSRKSTARKRETMISTQSPSTTDAIPASASATDLTNCWEAATPACIRALNNITLADPKLPISKNNSLGLFEITYYELYYQPSLNKFFQHFAPEIPQGTSPVFKPIAGPLYPETPTNYSSNPIDGLEVEGDLAVALPIIYPQNATTFTVEYGGEYDFLDIWLDALDSSYCSAKQPPYTGNGTRQCGIYKPPPVISLSYEDAEQKEKGNSLRDIESQCHEYLKLGLQGVTVLFASGDSGVSETKPSPDALDCASKEVERVFGANFPPSCPWVTAVGATAIPQFGTVHDVEIGAEWYGKTHNGYKYYGSSGGGFSLHFPPPSYQQDALARYFKDYPPKWSYFTNGDYHNNTGRYNRNGRGYPDISALGTNIVEHVGEKFITDNGTSFAAPLVGAMLNRIVEERLRAGKGSLGFVNPVLYQHPEIFKDVVKGQNGLCQPDQGFQAVPGWDPVTGLGVPIYPKLLGVFMNLK